MADLSEVIQQQPAQLEQAVLEQGDIGGAYDALVEVPDVIQAQQVQAETQAPVVQVAERRHGRLFKAVATATAAVALAACGSSTPSKKGNATKTTAAVSHQAFTFPGAITDGSDATIRAEDDAGLYNCGGVKGDTGENPDGTEKAFNPDHRIQHMNAHPTLAKSESDLWTGIMSPEGFAYLAQHGVGNSQHAENQKVAVDGVDPNFSDFLGKQNAVTIKTNETAGNFACKDANGNYHVFPVGLKELQAGKTHMTGVALTAEDYLQFVNIVHNNGGDLSNVFTQDMIVKKADGTLQSFVVVMTNAEMCGNPELKVQKPPVQETTTTTAAATTTDTTIPETGTTTPEVTTTTIVVPQVGPKEDPHEPGGSVPATTVPEGTVPQGPEPTVAPTIPQRPPGSTAPGPTTTTPSDTTPARP